MTTPTSTLLDIAGRPGLPAALDEAVKLDLVDPERLSTELDCFKGRQGVGPQRALLDADSYAPTESELERRFLGLARRAGLPKPATQARVNGFRVDFFWPDLDLVVETDGLRYHRTPRQQARDHVRDQAHAAAGLRCLRFTWAQVERDPDHVVSTLVAMESKVG